MAMIVAKKGERYCTSCGLPGPPAQMKRSLCKHCQMLSEQDAVTQQRRQQTETALRGLVSTIKGNRIDVPHISELTAQMIKRFGGLEQMTVEWKTCIDAAMRANPGSKTVLDQFYALAKLVLMSTEHRQSAPDLAGVTEAELESEMRVLMQEMCPDLKVFDESEDLDNLDPLTRTA